MTTGCYDHKSYYLVSTIIRITVYLKHLEQERWHATSNTMDIQTVYSVWGWGCEVMNTKVMRYDME
jgi:hypothetical protein